MTVIFFAGKGGVGKTSIAAAMGIRATESGKSIDETGRALLEEPQI